MNLLGPACLSYRELSRRELVPRLGPEAKTSFREVSRRPPPLGDSEVHLWLVSLEGRAKWLASLLSADERRRAACFHFEIHRQRFTFARGALRHILAAYVDVPPATIRFRYGPWGKPSLEGREDVCFNVSHTDELALIAVVPRARVGVDIERVRPIENIEQLAARYFSSHETRVFKNLPREQRKEAFFKCWTRKEAYMKAVGKGLSLPLDSFDVSFAPGAPAALLAVRPSRQDATDWSLYDVTPSHDCAAALAVSGHGWKLRCLRWCEPSSSSLPDNVPES